MVRPTAFALLAMIAAAIALAAVAQPRSRGNLGQPASAETANEPTTRPRVKIKTLPASRGGQDLVSRKFPPLTFEGWIGAKGSARNGTKIDRSAHPPTPGRPTLYRWWTDSCHFCEASLPAIEKLRKAHPALDVVGAYHPKPPRSVDPREIERRARQLGYDGAIAIDNDWSELRRAYLDSGERRATSVTILVDGDGVVRFVHPGPILFPSDDPRDARENADFVLLEKAVRALAPQ